MITDRLNNIVNIGDTIVYGRGRGDIGIGVVVDLVEKLHLNPHYYSTPTFFKIKMKNEQGKLVSIDATTKHFVRISTDA